MNTEKFLIVMCTVFVIACGDSNGGGKNYNTIVDKGWDELSAGDYEAAFEHFTEAVAKNPEQAAGYSGLAWSFMLMDDLAQASSTFNTGSAKTNPPADLYAGWGFVLSAQKSYANSNTRIDQALALDADWNISSGATLNLDTDDLHVMKAENYFMLGQFSLSLAEVKLANTSFGLNSVTTDDDKAALVLEIQRLKGL